MAVNINIPKPVIDYNDLDNKPNLVTAHSELTLDDGTNPHGTTASDVGLGNVDNTSDVNKPISTATQTALNGKQDIPIVVSSNITAENDRVYHVVANATFTDPTPVNGKGYVVIVRGGTATIGGNTGGAGTINVRLFHSGSWTTYQYWNINQILNVTEVLSNKSTNVNTDQASNTRYPSVKAVFDWAVGLFFPKPTGTTAQYLRGDGSLATFPTIPSITGLVPYTGATGDVDLDNFGLDAKFIKIKGTAGNGHLNFKHQSSASTAGGSESVLYADNSGNPKWKNDGNAVQNLMLENSAITGATKTKITYDSKGLVTAGADATTADIADSSNRRYVTDAQLTVIGNTSGTNTGDETQSSILSKLGWWKVLDTTDSNILTGVSTETIMKAVELSALTNGSKLKINEIRVTKAGVATCTIKAYINNVNNNLAGAVQILTTSSAFPTSGLIATIERTFKIVSGNIKGINAATGVFTDKGQNASVPLNATLPTGTLYLIVTLTQAVGESSQVELIDVSNF